MSGARELFIQQGSQTVTSWISNGVRNSTSKVDPPASEPDRPALKAAEELVARGSGVPAGEPGEAVLEEPIGIPDELFAEVEGREDVKAMLLRSLRSSQPVHILLVGEPGCGKSQLLQGVARLPHSRYAVGGATSSSGLIDYLMEKPSTRFLVIDELDKADRSDLYALYSLMESGVVTRLQHDRQEHTVRRVWVYAAANSIDKLPEALASRFVTIHMPSYTTAEREQLIARVLERREGLPPARARAIAAAVARRSTDPRDGIQVGRLAGAEGELGPIVDQVLSGRQRTSVRRRAKSGVS